MKTYSFLDTVLLVNGVEITGFDTLADDVITLERNTDSAAHTIGTDGEMTVSISTDRSGRITFRLSQTSDSNAFLSALSAAQDNGVFVPVAVAFRDTRGKDLVAGTQGYIPRPANMTRGQNATSQEWTIQVERLDMLHGIA